MNYGLDEPTNFAVIAVAAFTALANSKGSWTAILAITLIALTFGVFIYKYQKKALKK